MRSLKQHFLGLFFLSLVTTGFFLFSFQIAEAAANPPQTAGCFSAITGMNPAACAAWMANGFLTISGYFTWMGGLALNYAIEITILKMGPIVNSIEGIQYGWAVLRDVANIGLIFGLLAIGIGIILQISSFGTREVLARLIIIAILLNFSLFITKAVIQVGNAFAIVAYKQLNVATGGCAQGSACISDKFVEALRLPTIYSSKTSQFNEGASPVDLGSNLSAGKILLAGVFGSIFLIITGFIFLAGALLLVTRFVVLILLMITAPVAWMASILPTTRGLWSKWWSALWKEVFFAPAYLILLLITLYIAQDSAIGAAIGSGGGFSSMLSGDTSSVVLIVYFGIITGFMIASLILAKQIGSYGSGAVTGYGKNLAKNIGGYARRGAGTATFGLAGGALRNTVGRAAYNAVQNEDGLKKRVAAGGMRGLLAQAQLGAVKYGAKASYDARALPGVKKLGLGDPVKSYGAARKEQETSYADYAKSLGGKNAAEYAKNELEKDTVFSTLFMRTAARQKVAKKILEPIAEKQKIKEKKVEQQTLRDEIKETEEKLAPLTAGTTINEPEKQRLQKKRQELREKVMDIETELEELKEKTAARKDEGKEKKDDKEKKK